MLTRLVPLKTRMLLILTLLCLFPLLNCSGGGGGGAGNANLPDVEELEAQVEAAEITLSLTETDLEHERLLTETDAAGARAALVTWLQNRNEVAHAGESSDGYTVWIEYVSGIRASYYTDRSSGDISARYLGPAETVIAPTPVAALPPMTMLGQSNYLIAFLPFFFEMADFCSSADWGSSTACSDWLNFPKPEEDMYQAKFMAQYYHDPDYMTEQPLKAIVLLNEEASVGALAGYLSAHAFDAQHLYINTHGGVAEDIHGDDVMNMTVGERMNPSADHFRDLWDAALDGELMVSRMYGTLYWSVTPAFVRRWLGQRPAGSAPLHVHNAACYGYHDTMRSAFMESGAASYSGYDGRALGGFIMQTTETYMKHLTRGETPTEAHRSVVPDTDYTYGTETNFRVTEKAADVRWFHQATTHLDGHTDAPMVTPTSENFNAVDDPEGGVRIFSSLVNRPADLGGLPEGGIVGELSIVIPTPTAGTYNIENSDITAIYFSSRSGGLSYGATKELKEESPLCSGTVYIDNFTDEAGGTIDGHFDAVLVNESNVFETRPIGGTFSALRNK